MTPLFAVGGTPKGETNKRPTGMPRAAQGASTVSMRWRDGWSHWLTATHSRGWDGGTGIRSARRALVRRRSMKRRSERPNVMAPKAPAVKRPRGQ